MALGPWKKSLLQDSGESQRNGDGLVMAKNGCGEELWRPWTLDPYQEAKSESDIVGWQNLWLV